VDREKAHDPVMSTIDDEGRERVYIDANPQKARYCRFRLESSSSDQQPDRL